eukprot:981233-Rhodomonas_salina.2
MVGPAMPVAWVGEPIPVTSMAPIQSKDYARHVQLSPRPLLGWQQTQADGTAQNQCSARNMTTTTT